MDIRTQLDRRSFLAGGVGLFATALFPMSSAGAIVEGTRWELGDDKLVFAGPGGTILELSRLRHGLRCVNVAGQQLWSYNEAGTRRHALNAPTSLCVHDDRIFVANYGNSSVLVFDLEGSVVAEYGGWGERPGTFRKIGGVAIRDGYLYATDVLGHRVQVLDPGSGRHLATLGSWGQGRRDLNGPTSLAFDLHGQLHVADQGNRRIQVFETHGRHLATYGEDDVQSVRSLTFAGGRLHVADPFAGKVLSFDPTGRLIDAFEPAASGRPLPPLHVAAVGDGRICVSGILS